MGAAAEAALAAAATGFGVGISLILAIGAQNAFVLRQGLRREHVFWICLTCALSDALLIAAGVGGFGALAAAHPWLERAMTLGGAAFLLAYGAMRLRAALHPSALAMAQGAAMPLRAALGATLALTWLNPHVYLDTLALIGAVGARYAGAERLAFGAGAVTASFAFFFALGYGARALAPLFARPQAWRWLDLGVGALMWTLAFGLLTS
ncbi:L-lysine exporter family protein LysE/ArgO [Oceanicella actignis]|uniref:L-lysine exporter family protein LysE/ArgO n=1 Tax=Oceanicella actignis TaxID=1189325 RepID=A0A1M7S859_9RHOB|nr:LysE/ArgO family amino acid transporter [Oceanicella actignis]SET32232.1 L-lysine exporter family protein LysE/ArgO [Oceanicella actignis]SHN54807.1 L-lysine exporter family protein LysE/ArgO [Oceanicella actignis]